MRRKRQKLGREACVEILRRGTSGVLALEGDLGYPYAVPMSFVYDDGLISENATCKGEAAESGACAVEAVEDVARVGETVESAACVGEVAESDAGSRASDLGRLIFHSAKTGHKIDAIARNAKASFCVIDQDQVVPEKYTTFFRSAIAFGRIRMLDDPAEKRAAAELLGRRYAPDASHDEEAAEIDRGWNSLCMFELRIDHLTGKEAIELVKRH